MDPSGADGNCNFPVHSPQKIALALSYKSFWVSRLCCFLVIFIIVSTTSFDFISQSVIFLTLFTRPRC